MSVQQNQSWIQAIESAANTRGTALPPVAEHSMGVVIWRRPEKGRYVSVKRRLVSAHTTVKNPITWTFWSESEDQPRPVATLHETLEPSENAVDHLLRGLDDWLNNDVDADELQRFIGSRQPDSGD